ncbi:MAG: hypothetical protein WC575_02785 [Patescibacteria group bacterium]
MLLDIVILPPAKLRKKLGRLALEANRICKASCLVDNKKMFSHCSLFHINTSATRISTLYKIVKKLAVSYSTCQLRVNGCHESEESWSVFPLMGYGLLKKFRTAIFKNCANLRTGMMPPWSHRNLTRKEKENRKKYGVSNSPYVYKPHLTIGKFDSKCVGLVSKFLQNIRLSFKADTIAICQVNKNWQVTRIIKQFKVK